jgi:tetratricopeptide (TPR) repeat protein
MRAEEFTALKTARERARGAEIITVDAAANEAEGGEGGAGAGGEGSGPENGYRPRVSTWGVFPRPDNISKAYGGGRTIRPGDALESPEEKEARLKRQRAALESYRKKVGLTVDPRDEAEAARLVAAGNELMRKGALEEAATEYFSKAADLLPARSAIGGRARLQKAICLDSMGRRDEAFALYKSVEGHPLDTIGKETKRMLFGFQAMEDLKAHTISYSPDKEEYAPFFGKLTSDWDTQYVSSKEEQEEGSLSAAVAAVAVVAAPLLLFGALAMAK